MEKRGAAIFAFVCIALFLISDISLISNKSEFLNNVEEKVQSEGFIPEVQKVLSETPPPRTPNDLKELVLELQSVTPAANRTDQDADGLYDPVEAVIGTNAKANDSDSDSLLDYYEVMNGLDPLAADSNDDGLPDNIEVNHTQSDLDNDGIPNEWDFDNDGDGVNDDPDLSPFASSSIQSEFTISLQNSGNPTYMQLQIVPSNIDHLALSVQTWDWMKGKKDTQGLMKDLDYSTNDITIHPILYLTPIGDSVLPDSGALNEMGIVERDSGLEIPLFPVYEYGSIVALSGQLLYLNSEALDISLKAELQWKVVGKSDVNAVMLRHYDQTDKFIGMGTDLIAVGNASEEEASCIEWIKIGEDGNDDLIALQYVGGPFLTFEANNKFTFSSWEVGKNQTFRWSGTSTSTLRAPNGEYVVLDPTGILSTTAESPHRFFKIGRIAQDTVTLVIYDEAFRFTGITTEECLVTSCGVISTDNITEYTAASLVLVEQFSSNSTASLNDIPAILDKYEVNASCSIGTSRDRYKAFTDMSNYLIPFALDSLPENEILPVILAVQSDSKMMDLSDAVAPEYTMDDACSFDLAGSSIITSKYLETNWYNTSTNIGLNTWEIKEIVMNMPWDESTKTTFLSLAIIWDNGITTISAVDYIETPYSPNSNALNLAQNLLEIGLSCIDLGMFIFEGIEAYRFFKNPKFMDMIWDSTAKSAKTLTKLATKLDTNWFGWANRAVKAIRSAESGLRYVTFFKWFSRAMFVVGVMVDIGMSIWSGINIANQIGGKEGKVIGATYGIVSAIIGLLIIGTIEFAMAFVPILGWALAIAFVIADLSTGFTSKLAEYATRAFYGQPKQTLFMVPYSVVTRGPFYENSDSNGLNKDDYILVNFTVEGRIKCVDPPLDKYDPDEDYYLGISKNIPFTMLSGPRRGWWWDTGAWLFPTSSGSLWDSWNPGPTYELEEHYDGEPYIEAATEYNWSCYLQPGISMANYPINVQVCSLYKIQLVTHRTPFFRLLFGLGAVEESKEIFNSSGYSHHAWLHVDVFPKTLNDFLRFKVITANDEDGDGLLPDIEKIYGTSNWSYDTDSDKLNDKYEIEAGLNPTNADSDGDGVSDWYEYVYSTNASNSDSDFDGLDDFQEISGWIVSFNYLGNESLPFEIPVTSNPAENDTDHDGISDYAEYMSNTNPRSNDTDGNGLPDNTYNAVVSQAVNGIMTTWDIPNYRPTVGPLFYDIAVDDEGMLYVPGAQGVANDNLTIRKYDSNLNILPFPTSSHFNNLSIWDESGVDEYIRGMAIDRKNDYLYAFKMYSSTAGIYRFNMDGTVYNPDSWSYIPYIREGIDVDDEGNLYIIQMSSIEKYNSTRHLIHTYTMGSSAVDGEFDYATKLAVDEKYGFIYVVDVGEQYESNRVIMKYRLSDGAYLGDVLDFEYLGGSFIHDVDVDSDGYLYALIHDSVDGTMVRKYYPGGNQEDVGFRFSGNGTHSFALSNHPSIVVSPDKQIYIGEGFGSLQIKIWSFSQDIVTSSDIVGTNTDWDNDTLPNTLEINGWDITVNFSTGQETFHVTSSHLLNDTDHDGLDDALEYSLGSNPLAVDSDLDKLSDHQEWWESTHPGQEYVPPILLCGLTPRPIITNLLGYTAVGPSLVDWDTDGDLLQDGVELTFGSSPVNPDSDADGLSDLIEFLLNSNPNSADSDGDAADDLLEFTSNSSLLDADSDGDYGLDGTEYVIGTSPTELDEDGDNLYDGVELFLGTNPLLADSDNDGVNDDVEFALFLDPLNNDTDSDSIPDGLELQYGTNPLWEDTDWDGIPDFEDPDTYTTFDGPVVLVYDSNPANSTLEFEQALADQTTVIAVSLDDFLQDYTDYPYIVLVGQPDPDSYGVERLTYDLLEDTGSVLDAMTEEDAHEVAVRHGYWNDPQTVVIMSSAYSYDLYPVLQILRGWNVSILSDLSIVEYNSYAALDNGTMAYAVYVNEIDTFKATDCVFALILGGQARPRIALTRYNETTTPIQLTHATGLPETQISLGKYLDVSVTLYDSLLTDFGYALIRYYYKSSDLDLNGNGQLGELGDINETSLCFYYYNETTESWIQVTTELEWVYMCRLNTTDVEMYGESYSGYISIQVSEVGLFALAGQMHQVIMYDTWMTVIAIAITSVAVLGAVFTFRRYRRKEVDTKYGKLFDELRE